METEEKRQNSDSIGPIFTEDDRYKNYVSLSDNFDKASIFENFPEHIPTGFKRLDYIMGGGLPNGLTILGAVASLGKSTFSLQIAQNISSRGIPVIFFSLEMSKHEITLKSLQRYFFNTTANPVSRSKIKELLKNNDDSLNEAIEACRNETKTLFIVERNPGGGNFSGEDIFKYVKKFIDDTGTEPVVFVDYLQILDSPARFISDKVTVDKNIQELWRIANQYQIPVFVISSVNRDSYNRSISFSSFKESGGIEYSADMVLGMQYTSLHGKKEDKYFDIDAEKKRDPREIEIFVLKHRYGKTGESSFFDFYPTFNSFEEKDYEVFMKTLENLQDKAAADKQANAASRKVKKTPKIKESPSENKESIAETKKNGLKKSKH